MSQTLTPDQIEKILNNYKAKKEREFKYYHSVKKTDEQFIMKNRERAKEHYNNNKEEKKEKYESDKEFLKSRSLYNYYKKVDKINKFEEKYPDKVHMLKIRGVY
tara:strand:- start:5262 stop:5573 length:312 start_codon:yes stop_codon:yes gene_type:complete